MNTRTKHFSQVPLFLARQQKNLNYFVSEISRPSAPKFQTDIRSNWCRANYLETLKNTFIRVSFRFPNRTYKPAGGSRDIRVHVYSIRIRIHGKGAR